jgi:hypothetical protein
MRLVPCLMSLKSGKLLVAGLVAAVAAGAALAQTAPPFREAYLVRQDSSDCQNGNVSGQDPTRIGGTVIVVRNSDGTSSVKVAITATPNTTYNFFLKCVRSLGTITTFDEGEGEGQFSFRTNETGNIITFDMYPDGAPAGNKFQSVQLQF